MDVVNAVGFKNDCLIDHLTQFISVVDARIFLLKEQFESRRSPTAPETGLTEEIPSELVDGVCADLIREIRRLSTTLSTPQNNLNQEVVNDMTYVMAAWADETLLQTFGDSLPRRYKAAIERQFFGTMDAGEQVFAKISLLIGRRSQSDTALAAVYLLVLSLGFRGQYFGIQHLEQGHEVLTRYRDELANIALLASKHHHAAAEIGRASHAIYSRSSSHQQKILQITGVILAVWLAAIVSMEIGWHDVVAPVKRALLEATSKPTHVTSRLFGSTVEVAQ